MTATVVREPQPKQLPFVASDADIALYGGDAGSGKTWAMVVDPLRYIHLPEFGGVMFRRTFPEIDAAGALRDETRIVYHPAGARLSRTRWTFPSGATVSMSHLQRESDMDSWRGAQLSWIGFDQLETFTSAQFWFLVTRLRTQAAMDPCIRGTLNAEPGWVADLLAWWWNPKTGLPILERAGRRRWLKKRGDTIEWSDRREGDGWLSLEYYPAGLEDNLYVDAAQYEAWVNSASDVVRERLTNSNFLVSERRGKVRVRRIGVYT